MAADTSICLTHVPLRAAFQWLSPDPRGGQRRRDGVGKEIKLEIVLRNGAKKKVNTEELASVFMAP